MVDTTVETVTEIDEKRAGVFSRGHLVNELRMRVIDLTSKSAKEEMKNLKDMIEGDEKVVKVKLKDVSIVCKNNL